MKIVQPIGTIAGTAISKIAITLAEEFARQGHESTLVVWNRAKIDREIDPRVKIIETNLIGLSRRNIWTKILRLLVKTFVGSQLFLVFMAPIISRQLQKKVLDQGEYDIVLTHALSFFGFRKISHPFAVVVHNTKSKQLLRQKYNWQNELLRRIYSKIYSDKNLITVSKGIASDLKDFFGATPKTITTIYNPLDLKSLRKKSLLPIEAIPNCHDYVIAIGRNDPQKRFDRLLRVYAYSGIQEKLVILGRAAESEALKNQAKALGLESKVIFLGFKDNPYAYIKKAKALLMTSDYEGFGMVLVEALAVGTSVISTDCPSGPNEILVDDLSQWLVPINDEDLFSTKLAELVKQELIIEPDLVNQFDTPKVCRKYLDHLVTLTNN